MKNGSAEVAKQGDVFVLTMNSGKNLFNPTFIKDLNEALDFVQKYGAPNSILTPAFSCFPDFCCFARSEGAAALVRS